MISKGQDKITTIRKYWKVLPPAFHQGQEEVPRQRIESRMTEHKIAEQSPYRIGDRCLWNITLICTCGKRFHERGRTKENALKKAESLFRAHIPIR